MERVLLLIMVCSLRVMAAPVDKETGPYKVLRIVPSNEDQLLALAELWKNASQFQLDFWRDPSGVFSPVDVMVGPSKYEALQQYLNEKGLSAVITVPDVQKLIVSKQSRPQSSKILSGNFSRRYKDSSEGSFSISTYHSYEEIQQYMADLQKRYPNRARVFNIGQTHEGRSIQLIKVGNPIEEDGNRRAFWIDAGIHAREWIAPTTAIYFIHQLVTNYETDPIIRQYVDNMDWYILPVANPDGYEYSRSSTTPRIRLWRKNRSPEVCRWGKTNCCQGVDLNRNFDFNWGRVGSSHDICDEVYAGSEAFSEPETKAIRDFIAQRPGRFDGFVTLHSYSQIWMYPFGHKVNTYPEDVEDLKRVAVLGKRALEANFGSKYLVGTGADTLYPASGGSDDWAKEKAAVKYVYLLELRPEDHVFDGFVLHDSEIVPTGKETWDGVKVIADAILQWNGIKPLNRIPPARPKSQTANGKACVDTEKQCRWWSSFGGCTMWADMPSKCPKACRVCDPDTDIPDGQYSPLCIDQIGDCRAWTHLNLCNWVADTCQLSCGLCPTRYV